MSFLADGTEGHGPRYEALDDLRLRLDPLQRHGCSLLKAEEAAQRALVPLLVVDERRILLIEAAVVGSRGLLQIVDSLWRPEMALAGLSIRVVTAAREDRRGEGVRLMSGQVAGMSLAG